MKHSLKLKLRSLYARLLYHTGLHALVNRLMPPRLTILAGHCVRPGGPQGFPGGEHLPPDMTISEEKLEGFIAWFKRRYELTTVGEGLAKLGQDARRSMLALSFDDGYRDNHDVLLPLLERSGGRATVFVESRPLDERRVNWSHKYFWILGRETPFDFVHRYGEHCGQQGAFHALNQIATEGRVDPSYHLKRILKYDADPDERDRAIDAVFAELGGDEAALCEALYMDWPRARRLHERGVEIGGHTVSHPILSRLPPERAAAEIEEGARSIERNLGSAPRTFAYPWGRRWDFDDSSREAARRAGFAGSVTMHAGTNLAHTERTLLHRLAIDDKACLHLLVAEACGGFELLRKLGIDLSE